MKTAPGQRQLFNLPGVQSLPLLGAGPIFGLPVRKEGRAFGVLLFALRAEPEKHTLSQLEAVARTVAAVLANADAALESRSRLSLATDALRSEVTRLSVGRVASSERLKVARSLALHLGLDRLKPHDTFNIIQFNSTASLLFGGPQPATRDSLRTAHDYV